MGSPRPVVVVLMVSTFVEAVGDARFLALRGVVVALVSAGGAMGGSAIDGPAGCSGSDVHRVSAVAAVRWGGGGLTPENILFMVEFDKKSSISDCIWFWDFWTP